MTAIDPEGLVADLCDVLADGDGAPVDMISQVRNQIVDDVSTVSWVTHSIVSIALVREALKVLVSHTVTSSIVCTWCEQSVIF